MQGLVRDLMQGLVQDLVLGLVQDLVQVLVHPEIPAQNRKYNFSNFCILLDPIGSQCIGEILCVCVCVCVCLSRPSNMTHSIPSLPDQPR